MSKYIKLPKSEIENLEREFHTYIQKSSSVVNFNRTLLSDKRATLHISRKAYAKMYTLTMKSNMEVGWHGFCRRSNQNDAEYIIDDIIIYPQIVSASTVDTDQEEFQRWMLSLSDDEFKNMKMHGHSHVNMATTPSPVDENHYRKIKSQLKDDMFYIFVILNKKGGFYIEIFDKKLNLIFEKDDIDLILPQEIRESQKMIKNSKKLISKEFSNYYNAIPC